MKLCPYSANQTYVASGSIKKRTWNSFLTFGFLVGLSGFNAAAQKTSEWPCFHGSGSNSRGWFCLDFLTGKQVWKTDGKGSVTYADSMLYLLDERGTRKKLCDSFDY